MAFGDCGVTAGFHDRAESEELVLNSPIGTPGHGGSLPVIRVDDGDEVDGSPGLRSPWCDWHRTVIALACLLPAFGISPGRAADSAPPPFLQLRQTTLGYHGPSPDLTHLSEISIGWFGPTNVHDPLTGDLWWAANRAVEEANAEHADLRMQQAGMPECSDPSELPAESWPWPCRLIARWAVDPWGTGVSQLTRMVYDEQPLALLGSIDSASTHLAEQVVAKANLPLVSPITTDKSVTLAGVSWMFSCAPSDSAIARVLVDGILQCESTAIPAIMPVSAEGQTAALEPHAGQRSKIAVLACTDHESRMTAREIMREFSQRGRMPDFKLDVPPGASDLRAHLERLMAEQPEILLVVAGVEDSARIIQRIRQMEASSLSASAWRPVVFGTHAMSRARFQELAGDAGHDVRFPGLIQTDQHRPDWVRFVRAFESERRRSPDYTAVLTYDATRLLLQAIREAGPNRARIRDRLAQLSPWRGLGGMIEFDGTGQNQRTNLTFGSGDQHFAMKRQP